MLVQMAKVEVIGPKKHYYEALGTLHQLGTLHVEDMSKKIKPGEMLVRQMDIDEESEQHRKDFDNLVIKINSIISSLDTGEPIPAITTAEKERFYLRFWNEDCDGLKKEVDKLLHELEGKTQGLAVSKEQLQREQATLAKYETVVEKIKPIAKQLVTLEGFETVALLIDRKYKNVLDLIRSALAKITKDQFELVSADVDEETTAALIVFNKTFSEPVHSFLWAENVNQVRLPDDYKEMPFDEALIAIKERRLQIAKEISEAKGKLSEISKDWFTKLVALRDVLNDKCQEYQMVAQTGQTDYTFVVEGWLPRREIKSTSEVLKKKFGNRVVVSEKKVSEHELEEAPVVLDNPKWAKPFEEVLNLFGLPRYGTIDPTTLLAVFYPVFFGFIIGDIGYGILIVLAALWARKKLASNKFVSVIANMLLLAGAMAIFWGFMFGEAFGNLLEHFHLIKEIEIFGITMPFIRAKLLMPYLFLAIGVGIAHILLGLILGIVNALREKATGHMYESIGFIVLILAIFFIAFESLKIVTVKGIGPIGFLLLIVSLVLIVRGGGFMGIFHIPTLMSNIFSYARLMALGVAGVLLAEVANELAGKMGSIWVGAMIAFFLHLINLVVHSFSSTIHSVRLNVIEFFGKFYESGGKAYRPFKRTGGE